jgi:hypothetical protein
MPGALAAHDRQNSARHVQRAEEIRLHLGAELVACELFEEACLKVAGVVDKHVDAAKALDRRVHCRSRSRLVGDVEGDR